MPMIDCFQISKWVVPDLNKLEEKSFFELLIIIYQS